MSAPNAEASSSRALVKDYSKHKSHKDKHRAGSKHEHKSKDKSTEKHHKEGKEKKRKDHDRHKDPNRISNHSFEHRESRMRLSVPPKFAADWLAGVREVLDGMLMRYIPQMSGVLLAHWEHEFIDETVKIINESPYGVCDVQFRSVIWAPKIGMKLYGSHSLSSPSHLSLLFGKTFNVSIPLQHIPQDTYKFEHSDSPDDAPLSDDESDVEERDILDLSGPGTVEEVGRWRNTKTDKLVGDEGGKGIKFTVIGMQVNNHTLSLTGSLLADPTNPPPPPSPMTNMQAPLRSPSLSPEPEAVARRPAKQARYAVDSSADNTNASDSVPVSTAPAKRQNPTSSQPRVEEDVIDDRYLSARELKKKRKDEEKRKRDERKARKEERVLEHVQEVGAEASVTMQGVVAEDVETSTGKRKADGADKSSSKKRKV